MELVSSEEADMAWMMEMVGINKAYLITSSSSYEIRLIGGENSGNAVVLNEVNPENTQNAEIEGIYNRAIEKYPHIEEMNKENAFIIIEDGLNYGDEEQIIENLNQLASNTQEYVNDDIQELQLIEKQDFINIKEERAKHLNLRAKAYINESFMGYRHLAYPTVESEVASDEYIAYADSYSPDYLVPKEEYQRAPFLDVVLKSFPIENYKNTDFTGLVNVNKQVVEREKIDQLGNDDVIEKLITAEENKDIENVIEEAIGNTDTSSNIESIIDADNESNIESDESNAVNTVSKDADNPVTDVIEKVIENEKAKQDQLEDIISTLDEVKETDEKPVRVDKLNEAMREIDEIQNNSSNVVDEVVMTLNDNDMSEQAEVIKAIQNKDDENAAKLDEVRNIISEILDADSNNEIEFIQEDIRDLISESEIDIQALGELKEEVSEILNQYDEKDDFEAFEKSLNDSEEDINKIVDTEVEEAINTDEEPYRWTLTISLLGVALLAAGLIFAGIAIKKSRKKGE